MLTVRDIIYKTMRETFARFGLRVAIDHPVRNPMRLLQVKAAELGLNTVLDVGANSGQFASELRAAGYQGRIVSFEPLTSVHAVLQQAAQRDAHWTVAPRMALGDTPGQTQINISQNLASSSLLAVDQRSVDAAPESGYTGVDDVEVRRLDDVADPSWSRPFALKLDTQGFEMHVLRGAERTLQDTALVMVELSLVPLYRGGASLTETYQYLEAQGFRCISIVQGFADNARNELLQVDGIFREKLI